MLVESSHKSFPLISLLLIIVILCCSWRSWLLKVSDLPRHAENVRIRHNSAQSRCHPAVNLRNNARRKQPNTAKSPWLVDQSRRPSFAADGRTIGRPQSSSGIRSTPRTLECSTSCPNCYAWTWRNSLAWMRWSSRKIPAACHRSFLSAFKASRCNTTRPVRVLARFNCLLMLIFVVHVLLEFFYGDTLPNTRRRRSCDLVCEIATPETHLKKTRLIRTG